MLQALARSEEAVADERTPKLRLSVRQRKG
jgi:hypothetical protein